MGWDVGGPWSCPLSLGALGAHVLALAIHGVTPSGRGRVGAQPPAQVVAALRAAPAGPVHGHPPAQAGGQAHHKELVVVVASHGVQHLLQGLPAHGAILPGLGPEPDAPKAELVHAIGHKGRLPHGTQADGALRARRCLQRPCPCSRATLPRAFFGTARHVLPREMWKVLEVVWPKGLLGMLSCSLSLALQLWMSSKQREEGQSSWLAWGQVEEMPLEGNLPSLSGYGLPSLTTSMAMRHHNPSLGG